MVQGAVTLIDASGVSHKLIVRKFDRYLILNKIFSMRLQVLIAYQGYITCYEIYQNILQVFLF